MQNEHDKRLSELLKQAQKLELKLNRQKREFGVTEITYLGDKLSAAGIQPDPEIRAVADKPAPKDQTDLQRALGIVNYMSKFIPNLSANTKGMRSLLEKKSEWQWEHHHAQE